MGQGIKLVQILLSSGSKFAICISLSVAFVTGITINTLIMHVLRQRNVLKRNTTLIWKHLLISNFIGCLLEIPAIITHIIAPFIKVTEIIYQSILFVTLLSSCGCFLLIFIDRIDCVTRPFEKRLNSIRIKIGLGLTWSAGLLGITFLSVEWIAEYQKGHFVLLTVLCSLAHFALMAVIILTFIAALHSYYRIFSFIRSHNKNAEDHGVSTTHRLRRRQIGISKSFCAQTALFAFFYLPYILTEIIKITWKPDSIPLILYLILQVLFSFRYTCSSIAYCAMSRDVSKCIQEVLKTKHYSRNQSYCSTFKESKRAWIPTPIATRSQYRINTSIRTLTVPEINFCTKNKGLNTSSKLKSNSNSTCDAFSSYFENYTRPITFQDEISVDGEQSQESESSPSIVSNHSNCEQLATENYAVLTFTTQFHEKSQDISEDKLSNVFCSSEFCKETTV